MRIFRAVDALTAQHRQEDCLKFKATLRFVISSAHHPGRHRPRLKGASKKNFLGERDNKNTQIIQIWSPWESRKNMDWHMLSAAEATTAMLQEEEAVPIGNSVLSEHTPVCRHRDTRVCT